VCVAAELLDGIPESHRSRIARFLEAKDHRELAMEVSEDPDHKFELAIALEDLEVGGCCVKCAFAVCHMACGLALSVSHIVCLYDVFVRCVCKEDGV